MNKQQHIKIPEHVLQDMCALVCLLIDHPFLDADPRAKAAHERLARFITAKQRSMRLRAEYVPRKQVDGAVDA